MQKMSLVNRLVRRAACVVAFGLMTGPAMADGFGLDIRIGAPPPPRRVIVREEVRVEPVYETYVVGYRRDLYDADLKLRIARADQWQAHEELEAARRREGELAVELDGQEAIIAQLRERVGDREGNLGELHARVEATAARIGELHTLLRALEHRIAGAREDYEASKTLGDRNGMGDASDRITANEGKSASAFAQLHEAEHQLDHLRHDESEFAAVAADRDRLQEARVYAGELRHKLDVAHDAVYVTQNRLTTSQDAVFTAMHDRDEALWLLHRDEIYAGRFDADRCGFSIDLSLWGGRLPRDPEVLHAYCVHDVGYWRSNPVVVEERIVIADRAPEMIHIRSFEKVREVERIERVEKVEVVVKVEDRRRVAVATVQERQRFEAETVERKTAAAEHRAPKPVYIERPTNVTINKTTIINQNVTTVNKGNPKEEAKLRSEVRKDDAKIAEQSRQLDKERASDRKSAEEVARAKAEQERADKSRAAADKAASKNADRSSDKSAGDPKRGADTTASARAREAKPRDPKDPKAPKDGTASVDDSQRR